MALSNNQINKTYLPLIKLSKREMQFVEDDFHHACLSKYNLHPSFDNRYNDYDLSIQDIVLIIDKYGKTPSKNHWYWDEIQNNFPETNQNNNIEK